MVQDDLITDVLFRVEQALRDHLRAARFHEIVSSSTCNNVDTQRAAIDRAIAAVWSVEDGIRTHWGGSDVYIAKRTQQKWADKKQLAIDEARRTGRIADAASNHGVPRSSLYRWILRRDT